MDKIPPEFIARFPKDRLNRRYERALLLEGWLACAELFQKKLDAKQYHIDQLMLEYCPDEMMPEQIAGWGKHQRPAAPEYQDTAIQAEKEQGNGKD